MGRIYGYVHVWPDEQDIDNQIITMHDMQVADRDIFIDRQSSYGGSHQEYQKLLKRLKANDLLYINSLDALGENCGEIGKRWRMLTKEKKADVVVLDMPQLDTRRGKTQFNALVADLVLSMLEYIPNAEHLARRKRQKEGIAQAKRHGVQFGRPERPLPENFSQVYRMWRNKEIRVEKAAELCGMSRSLFYKKVQKFREQEESWQDPTDNQ